MAYNGAGVFVRLYNWVNDAAAGIKIRADRQDAELNGIATGLSTCITKDGQTTITANLPMAGFRHTGVGDAAALTDYASYAQVRKTAVYCATVGGTADVITLTNSPAFAAYVTGMVISWIASGANTTNVTVNIDGLGAKALTKGGSNALVANDIPSSSFLAFAEYDGTRFQLLNPYVVATAVTDATITTTDVTTNNVTSTKHGWAPKSPADATKFLNGAGTPAYAAVKDSDLAFTDITTNNVSTSKHGLMPKAANSAATYYDSLGTQTNPALNAVLTGYTAGAGTVAATDTVIQAIQKVDANTATAGLTVIATTTPGAVATVDFTSIPATYRALVLYASGVSCASATQGFTVQADCGSGLGTAAAGWTMMTTTTPTSQIGSAILLSLPTQPAATTNSGSIYIPAYQSGPFKTCTGAFTESAGGAISTITGMISATGALQGLRCKWSGGGNFDAGTITLYGVN